jgi:hypothetical protein
MSGSFRRKSEILSLSKGISGKPSNYPEERLSEEDVEKVARAAHLQGSARILRDSRQGFPECLPERR